MMQNKTDCNRSGKSFLKDIENITKKLSYFPLRALTRTGFGAIRRFNKVKQRPADTTQVTNT